MFPLTVIVLVMLLIIVSNTNDLHCISTTSVTKFDQNLNIYIFFISYSLLIVTMFLMVTVCSFAPENTTLSNIQY